MRRKYKLLAWIPVIIMFAVIFAVSSEKGSQSDMISQQIVIQGIDMIENVARVEVTILNDSASAEVLNTLIRKIGHIIEYTILAIAIEFLLYIYKVRGRRLLFLCFGICFIYACSDEFHQLFISDRSGKYIDVLIDSVGIMTGMGLFYVLNIAYKKYKNICD
jgi:VanZ family protein